MAPIRPGTEADFLATLDIYNHYVRNGSATFDEVPVAPEARRGWFERFATSGRYRLLIAEDDFGAVVGYACSGPYRSHVSFDETVEFSIYLRPRSTGKGFGRQLYQRLISDLSGEPVHRAVAGIALPNQASVALHRSCGFQEVGVFDEYAKKGGRYISSLWMQRPLVSG